MANIPGGWTEPREAEEETQKTCDQVKPDVEKKLGKNYKVFKATFYRSQVAGGLNYLIKVHVGGDSYIHIELGGPCCSPRTLDLLAVEENHTKDDPLDRFLPF